jgi:S-adenosylmethionine hydrolase
MAILLFTDFGSADIYVGQVKQALAGRAPGVPVIDLLHDAPPFNIPAGAHLLAALATRMSPDDVLMAVVDPGVGGPRRAVAIRAGKCWFVAPDNGLASIAAARAGAFDSYSIGWRPDVLAVSFHGRDVFAPVAAMLARGEEAQALLERVPAPAVQFGTDDLAEIIYVDHYGNAMTGLRGAHVGHDRQLAVGGSRIPYAPVFSAVPDGAIFWYENSIGLVEIAANKSSAAHALRLSVGEPVGVGA